MCEHSQQLDKPAKSMQTDHSFCCVNGENTFPVSQLHSKFCMLVYKNCKEYEEMNDCIHRISNEW